MKTGSVDVQDFMRQRKPDSSRALWRFMNDFVHLHRNGFTIKAMHEYARCNGYEGSYTTVYRWIRNNVDFDA